MNIDTIIKGLVKEFEMEGTKEFLKNFNMASKRVDQMSMFIGKYKNFTFMCNGQALMGYMKRPGEETIQFTFRSLNELPWTNLYNKELKIFIKKVVDQFFITNNKLMYRYQLIIEASKNYEAILLRALAGKVVRVSELRKQTQLLIANKTTPDEVAYDRNDIPKPEENKKEGDKPMNVMKLAHKIRRDEKLEGHYHAQMKYALQKAYAILNQTGTIIEDMSENFKEEVASDESMSTKEDLTVQEVLEKYKGKYDAYVYFEGYNIHLNIKGKTQILTTKYRGIKLEREFISKLQIFNQLNRTLIIHHFNVFEPHNKIDFIKIPC